MNNNLVNELWKVINDFPMYEVSDQGNIRNIKTGRIRKPQQNWSGYQMVTLRKDNKTYTKQLHRQVAIAFIPNSENLPCCDHINGLKWDNRACNLRWCTQKENANYKNHKPKTEEQKARQRKSYYRNRESRLEQMKQYREEHKEQIKQWRDTHKDYMKQYYQAHKEQRKLYYQQNKEKWQKYYQNKKD